MTDLRPRFFDGFDWYERLRPPKGSESTAWWLAKGPANDDMWVKLLHTALSFAQRHELVSAYRARFGGLHFDDLSLPRAKSEARTQTFPIWEIANELVVGCYLERVFEWQLTHHQPAGKGKKKGEWQFRTRTGRSVFVEVKSLSEPIVKATTGAFAMRINAPRITQVLKKAYRQLPADGRGTLVVLVGNRPLWAHPAVPLVGAVPAALFGYFGVRLKVMPYDPADSQAGPSFYDMFVQHRKNRGLGCVAALRPGGADEPTLAFYAIHNPYAQEGVRLAAADLPRAWQLVFESEWGRFVGEDDPAGAWQKTRD